MHDKRSVRFYFDFVSPYSWLALKEAASFAKRHGIVWVPRPIVYSALLDTTGLVGPVETSAKRRYTFHDVVRCARRDGRSFVGPPVHPFRSLEALRLAAAHQDDRRGLELATTIAEACWGAGRDLTDLGVLSEVAGSAGFVTGDLRTRIERPDVKRRLRTNTERAIERGVFGVPTFGYGDHLFWGYDRLDHLADALGPEGPLAGDEAERMLARPRGVERKRRPD